VAVKAIAEVLSSMDLALPRYSPISADEMHRWLNSVESNPEKRQVAQDALDAFDRVLAAGILGQDDLKAVIESACSRASRVWNVGTDLLMRLACQYEQAREAIRQILMSGPANARFQVITAITRALPVDFAREIIGIALRDKGSRIRQKGAEAADRLGLSEMLPDLEKCMAIEKNRSTSESLAFHHAMLRSGYQLKYQDGEPRLCVRMPHGWCCPAINAADIEAGRLDSIINEARFGQTACLIGDFFMDTKST
jgi:hypothetical protein